MVGPFRNIAEQFSHDHLTIAITDMQIRRAALTPTLAIRSWPQPFMVCQS
jgi:hypothetical protein